jgi:hypothetical protein
MHVMRWMGFGRYPWEGWQEGKDRNTLLSLSVMLVHHS